MMVPLKVCTLTEQIAITYLAVSDKYIMPAQRKVGTMMEFSKDSSEEGKKNLIPSLTKAQRELNDQTKEAAEGIVTLIQGHQKWYQGQIEKRVNTLIEGVSAVLPSVANPSESVLVTCC